MSLCLSHNLTIYKLVVCLCDVFADSTQLICCILQRQRESNSSSSDSNRHHSKYNVTTARIRIIIIHSLAPRFGCKSTHYMRSLFSLHPLAHVSCTKYSVNYTGVYRRVLLNAQLYIVVVHCIMCDQVTMLSNKEPWHRWFIRTSFHLCNQFGIYICRAMGTSYSNHDNYCYYYGSLLYTHMCTHAQIPVGHINKIFIDEFSTNIINFR